MAPPFREFPAAVLVRTPAAESPTVKYTACDSLAPYEPSENTGKGDPKRESKQLRGAGGPPAPRYEVVTRSPPSACSDRPGPHSSGSSRCPAGRRWGRPLS